MARGGKGAGDSASSSPISNFGVKINITEKIIKTVTTRSHNLKLNCTKFDFGFRPRWRSLQLSADSLIEI